MSLTNELKLPNQTRELKLDYVPAPPRIHASLDSPMGTLKRCFDVVSSAAGLLVLMPYLLVLALVIRLDSPGPVLFKQCRVGRDGQEFWMFKFRTMKVGAELMRETLEAHNEMQFPLFKMRNDPRVTRIGGWLRRSSQDELPQLLNVLLGEMSLVGPRPPLAVEAESFEPWQRGKFSVRPGITGLWQVNGRNNVTSLREMIELDLAYIRTWSFFLDVRILLKTVLVVGARIGVY